MVHALECHTEVAHQKGQLKNMSHVCCCAAGAVFSPLGAAAAKLHGGPPLVFVNFTALKDDLEDPALAAATSLQVSSTHCTYCPGCMCCIPATGCWCSHGSGAGCDMMIILGCKPVLLVVCQLHGIEACTGRPGRGTCHQPSGAYRWQWWYFLQPWQLLVVLARLRVCVYLLLSWAAATLFSAWCVNFAAFQGIVADQAVTAAIRLTREFLISSFCLATLGQDNGIRHQSSRAYLHVCRPA